MALIDNFDGYSDGDLNGQGDWSGDVYFDIQGSVVQAGAKAVQCGDTAAEVVLHKHFTLQSAGRQIWYERHSTTGGRTQTHIKETTGDKYCTAIDFRDDGHIWGYVSGANQDLGTYAVDTWYKCEVQWQSTPSHQVRYQINDGGYSDWAGGEADWTTGLDQVEFMKSAYGTNTAYWDSFADPNISTTNIKKVSGVAYASIKKISGVAIASIKKVAGVT